MPKVSITVSAQQNASSTLKTVESAIRGVSVGVDGLTSSIFKGNVAADVFTKVIGKASTLSYEFAKNSLVAYGSLEQNQVALTTILKDASTAAQLIKEMQTKAVETPFNMQDYVAGGKALIALGDSAGDLMSDLEMLGDIAAGVSIPLSDMVQHFGKLQTQGRAYNRDLRELAGRGIPVYSELAKVMGVNKESIRGLAEQGKVSFDHMLKIFKNMTKEGGQFHDMMLEQSKTLMGMLSNMNDALDITISKIGKEMAPAAKEAVRAITESLQEGGLLSDFLKKVGELATLAMKGAAKTIKGADDTYRKTQGTSENLKEGYEYEVLNQSGASKLYSILKGESKLLDNNTVSLNANAKAYKEWMDKGYTTYSQVRTAMNNYDYDKMEADRLKRFNNPMFEHRKKGTDADEEALAKQRQSDLEWLHKLTVEYEKYGKSKLDILEIDRKEKHREVDLRKGLTKSEKQQAKTIVDAGTDREKWQTEMEYMGEEYKKFGKMQIELWTESGDAGVDMWGRIGNAMNKVVTDTAKNYGDMLKELSKKTSETGLTTNQQIGLVLDTLASGMEVVSVIFQAMEAVRQQSYKNQLNALERFQTQQEKAIDAERDAALEALGIEEKTKLELAQESLDELIATQKEQYDATNALRLEQLALYEASLKGQTDADIAAALAKKKLDYQTLSEAEEKARQEELIEAQQNVEIAKQDELAAKKKEALELEIEKKKYAIELANFNRTKEYQKKMIAIETAIGITRAWAGAMKDSMFGPVFVIAAAAALTSLMVGAAAMQIKAIDEQEAPAPNFYKGVTNFEGGNAIVGERGRELVTLPRGANVITNENTEKLLSGSNQPVYFVNEIYLDSTLVSRQMVESRRAASYGGY